jgi:hypothetical protein
VSPRLRSESEPVVLARMGSSFNGPSDRAAIAIEEGQRLLRREGTATLEVS